MRRVIYHMDADGKAAAAVVAHFLRKEGKNDIYFHPINYGMELNTRDWNIEKDEVFLVDFSFQPLSKMEEFARQFPSAIWIDHHATALEIEEQSEVVQELRETRDLAKAGCELTWEYFTADAMPPTLKLIGDWDMWRRGPNWENDVVPFQSFLYLNDDRPMNSKFWEKVLSGTKEELESWLGLGRIARVVQTRMEDSTIGAASFVCKFAGHRAVMCNGAGSSLMFERNYDISKFDLLVLFQLKQGKYVTVSIYGTDKDIHCGHLAKQLGEAGPIPSGGGHAKAAGFQGTWEYVWSLVTDIEDGKPWRITSTKQSINDVVKL